MQMRDWIDDKSRDEERAHFLQHLLNGDCDLPDPWKYLDLEAWNIASLAGISVSLKQQKVVLEPLHDFYLLLGGEIILSFTDIGKSCPSRKF